MGATNLLIRPAVDGDLPALLELYQHLNHDEPSPEPAIAAEQFDAILARPGMTVFIGFADGRAAATVTLIIVPNLTRLGASYALIENVVTHADHRKRGYAGALIRAAIDAAWAAGCYKVMLLTGSKNPATLRFYESCGFDRSRTGFQIRRL
ncbi:GNAT family N-acetyltransferase [Rhizobium terrae]|uniref:GNAT family N-acetyltransferase n=1 Tax=Rhizobium terrae TaxID=2171756 RepID=UPI000E3BAF40|nr:GNAT family N-acetyltransferase [Rhizobium terrae]